jgi:molybdenum cofactor cytidylyltransferase
MLAALILAAGASRRMGAPKALLRDARGRTFVGGLARTFADAGVSELVVVTADAHDGIVEALAAECPDLGVRPVRNEDPARGQLSSLWTGLNAVERPALAGILVTPVDVPLLLPATVRAVVDAWRDSRARILRPAMGDRHGHPVLFDRAVFDDLRRAPLEAGAKAVLLTHARSLVNVPVTDEGCLLDVDTPEDYRRHFSRKT